jgi:hypothetical protein
MRLYACFDPYRRRLLAFFDLIIWPGQLTAAAVTLIIRDSRVSGPGLYLLTPLSPLI